MTLKVIGMNAVKSVPKAADETSSDSEAPDDDVASDKSCIPRQSQQTKPSAEISAPNELVDNHQD